MDRLQGRRLFCLILIGRTAQHVHAGSNSQRLQQPHKAAAYVPQRFFDPANPMYRQPSCPLNVKHLSHAATRPENYTVAWIAPLEIETQAALHMLDERHEGGFPVNRGDDCILYAGKMCGHNIMIATFPAGQEYGTGSAAALASQIKRFFPNL
jgi:hypothetical protein